MTVNVDVPATDTFVDVSETVDAQEYPCITVMNPKLTRIQY